MALTADFAAIPGSGHAAEIERLCDAMEAAGDAGCYSRLTVERPWSADNPVLEGEFAAPRAIRWYLERELGRLAASGARISVCPGREALDPNDYSAGFALWSGTSFSAPYAAALIARSLLKGAKPVGSGLKLDIPGTEEKRRRAVAACNNLPRRIL